MRNGQVDRLVATFAVLRQNRFPAPIEDIHRDTQEKLGERFCERTTRRDLECLERLGMAERGRTNLWMLESTASFFEAAAVAMGRAG
jgi:hypothetical protein